MQTIKNKGVDKILKEAKVIAVVGHSDKSYRTSYSIAQYLRQAGYKVYPVNPLHTEINGEISYPSVTSIPEKVDIVNVFRRSKFLDSVAEDAIKAGAQVLWAQSGVFNKDAGEKAEKAGLIVVMDSCIKIEHLRM